MIALLLHSLKRKEKNIPLRTILILNCTRTKPLFRDTSFSVSQSTGTTIAPPLPLIAMPLRSSGGQENKECRGRRGKTIPGCFALAPPAQAHDDKGGGGGRGGRLLLPLVGWLGGGRGIWCPLVLLPVGVVSCTTDEESSIRDKITIGKSPSRRSSSCPR